MRATAAPSAEPGEPDDSTVAFVREHQGGLWRYVRLLGASTHDAEDLVQETFVALLRRNERPTAPTALLRTIARGLWIDRHRWLARRRAVEIATEVDALLAPEASDPHLDEWLQALAHCRERLAERSRMALDLAYRDGRDRNAIAAALGIAANTVRNLLATTRRVLANCIENHRQGERR